MKEDIAIIGMDCIFPGAPDIQTYWQNIISKVNSITDPPKEAWDSDTYYDPDSLENDRVYCRRGGYIGQLAHFDPLDYGIMPTAVEGGEPDQWLALKVAHNALHDAGYQNRPPEGKKTAVILGKGNYLSRGNLSVVQNSVVVDQTLEILKTLHPEYTSDDLAAIRKELKQCLPAFNAETVSGLIPNIIASRIANRLDLMGPCYTVDGACASSLLAMDIAVRELLEKKIDLALVGGSQVATPVGVFGVFCQLNALSRKEQIRPFDQDADGTILGEGIGMIILKRRSDAERDGNRIYALIKGVGTSSDGRGVGVLAPRIEGGVLAMQRAYERGGISPSTIGLIEAHGTGTLAGDINEMHALKQVFGPRNNNLPWCAVGSVKSMIGHAMPAAGIAGIIKTALSLYHKVLPPTLNVDQPNPKLELEKSPFYINTETRPWFHDSLETPRRAGVNAFGFGGINAHAILEEYRGKSKPNATFHHRLWDTEVFILQGKSRDELITQGKQLQDYLLKHPQTELKDLAHTLNTLSNETTYRLTIVASSLKELETKLARAIKQLTNQACRQIKDVHGIYFFEQPLKRDGKLAFLFPGEGSQYINMLSDLCIHFPEIRQCFDKIDRIFSGSNRDYLPSDFIFPRPVFSEGERKAAEERLWKMDGAIEAVLTANEALFKLLSHLEIKPDVILGHSTGEYSAMSASGIFNITDGSDHGQRALELNQSYRQKAAGDGIPHARLVAVGADTAKVAALIDRVDDELYIAMDNCPHQTVIAGAESGIQKAVAEMNRQGLIYQILPFDRPYHTPLFKAYAESLHQFFERWPVSSPTIPHYSCTTIAPFSTNPDEISKLAVEHWVRPVEFRKTIEKMYKDGVRIFVEVGPKSNLTAFVDDILRGREYMAVPTNTERRSGITQINHLVGILAAHGVPINTDYLYRRRAPRKIFLDQHPDKKEKAEKPKTKKKIATGWPPMRVSNETAKRLNSRVSAKENDSTLSSNDSLEVKEGLSNVTSSSPSDRVLSKSLHEIDAHRQSEAEHVPASEVMSNYLKTMEHFLETQQQIMQTFLSTAVEEGQDDGREKKSKVKTKSPLPSPEKADDHPLTLKQDLIEIVSEKTGYPKEMLDLNLDMEADLGIDSIKRTEIMGVLNERYGGKLGQEMDQLSALKTLKQVVDFLEGHPEGVGSPTLEPTKVINKSEGEEKKAAFSESAEAKSFPFIGKVISLVPGQKLEALRRISLDEDLYLKDHTIGGKISCMDNSLRPLAVMPLTLSMEILAEAASLLVPDKVLVSMKNIHAYKWIALEESSHTLQIVACRTQEADNQVEVKIYNYEEGKSPLSHPMIEGTMVFADTYPEAKVPDSFSLQSKRTSKWTPKQLYTEAMFHGPCWQGVSSIDSWGEDGSIATLKVLSASGFFRSDKNPEFVTDPIALDAAGQIVGFWTMEHLKSGFLVFPFRVKALHIYRPQLPLHQKVKCQTRIKLLGTTQVLSNIDLIGEDGHIWMRLEGWEDKRFDLPSEIYPFLLSPIKVIPSMRWDAPIKSFPDPSYFCCFRMGDPFKGDKTFWKRVFSHLILNRNERKTFRTLGKSEKRQTEWLMGRLVAKDAVRMTLKEHYGIEVGPADINIEKDVYGNPVPGGAWSNEIETVPALSLAHTNGLAVAIACHLKAGQRLGVDIEGIRSLEQGVEKIAFTQKEQSLLDSVEESLRQQWVFRFWCAKEAVAKALGRGLIEGPKSLSVQRLEVKTGTVKIALQGKLADEFPDLADATVLVHTAQEKDYIFASTICQRD